MNVARQYFTTCTDLENEFAYVIGGYNHELGLINLAERYSFKARKWI